VPDEDRRRLFQHAKLSVPEQDAVNNLVLLGSRVVKGPGDREGKKRLKQKPSGAEDEYELSRFKPVVASLLEVRSRLLFLLCPTGSIVSLLFVLA
jgi:syntaxin-binding protein 1